MNPHSKSEVKTGTHLRDKVKNLVRDELLRAAEGIFAEEGLQTAKVENIAARAGVSVGTVYNYFVDRKALVDAVMEQRKAELIARLDQLSRDTEGRTFFDRLDAMLREVLNYFHGQRPYFLLMMQAEGNTMMLKEALMASRDPCQGPFGPVFSHFEQLMAQGIAERVLRDEEPRMLAKFLFGMTKGFGLSNLADSGAPDIRDSRETILRFFQHGAGPIAPSSH
jgi:AcrR family transcriptional regulator